MAAPIFLGRHFGYLWHLRRPTQRPLFSERAGITKVVWEWCGWRITRRREGL